MAVEIYPLFFGGRAEKEALDPVAKAMLEKARARVEVRRVVKLAPHPVPASFLRRDTLAWVLLAVAVTCLLKVRLRSSVTPRYFGVGSKLSLVPLIE